MLYLFSLNMLKQRFGKPLKNKAIPLLCLAFLSNLQVFNAASMNKLVLKVELQDDKIKKKAMKVVSNLSGVESVCVDMKEQKLTLIGDIDAVIVVSKLRKLCHTDILSIGPAKEERKEKGKEKNKAENNSNNNNDQNQNLVNIVKVYEAYQYENEMRQPHYYYTSLEENPNACVIC